MERMYLDHAATSPMHPDVIEEMTSVMKETFGNPSSIHAFGRASRQLVDEARNAIAGSIHADYNEIIFTSGELRRIIWPSSVQPRHIKKRETYHHDTD